MKKLLLIGLPILLLLGVVGLGLAGVINIPGLTPAKKHAAAQDLAKGTEKAQVSEPIKKPVVKKPPPPPAIQTASKHETMIDKDKGAEQLAELWNEMEAGKLGGLIKDWEDADAARVFIKMDPGKVAEVLALLDPKRASKISQMIEKESSIVKVARGA